MGIEIWTTLLGPADSADKEMKFGKCCHCDGQFSTSRLNMTIQQYSTATASSSKATTDTAQYIHSLLSPAVLDSTAMLSVEVATFHTLHRISI